MNLRRLRELTAAGQAGTIRPEELKELFEALPSVLDAAASELWARGVRDAISTAHKQHCEGVRAAELQADREKIRALIENRTTDLSWVHNNRLVSFSVLPFRWFNVRS